MEINLAQITG